MTTKRENIACRPGTTDAMQRLADENEALRAERDELSRYRDIWFAQGFPEPGAGLLHAMNHEGHRVVGTKESVSHFMAEYESAHASGAREALERAIQSKGFSGTVVRVDVMREIIEQMEKDNG